MSEESTATDNPYDRFSISRKYRLIDSHPMKNGKPPKMWDAREQRWTTFDGTLGEHMDSIPVTQKEAQAFMDSGERPERVVRWITNDVEMPEPWDD